MRANTYHLNMTENAMHSVVRAKHQNTTKPVCRITQRLFVVEPSRRAKTFLTGIPNLLFAETVFDIEVTLEAFDRLPMSQPKQKPILLMRLIIQKFTKSGNMVPDLFMGTGATEKACLLEPRHRNFSVCDADSSCVSKVMPSLLLVFVEQALHPEYDVTEIKNNQKAVKRYLE